MDLKIRIAAAFVSTHTNMNTNTNANTNTQTCIHMRIRTYLFVDCPLFHPKKKVLEEIKSRLVYCSQSGSKCRQCILYSEYSEYSEYSGYIYLG